MTDSVESVLQKSREEFEKWAIRNGYMHEDRKRSKDGTYFNSNAELCWCVWQASRSALEPMLAELKQLREDSEVLRYTDTILTQHYGHTVSIGKVLEDLEAAEQALREAQAAAKEAGYDSGSLVSVIENARQDSEKLRELLRRDVNIFTNGIEVFALFFRLDLHKFRKECWEKLHDAMVQAKKETQQALSPSPTPAQASCCNRQTCKLSGDVIPPLTEAATTGKGEQG